MRQQHQNINVSVKNLHGDVADDQVTVDDNVRVLHAFHIIVNTCPCFMYSFYIFCKTSN